MILDTDGRPLKKGRVYRITSAASNNRFRCTKGGTPNTSYFRRTHDNESHRGREFIEFRDGKPYYNLQEARDD